VPECRIDDVSLVDQVAHVAKLARAVIKKGVAASAAAMINIEPDS
jgi:hypothetical protein